MDRWLFAALRARLCGLPVTTAHLEGERGFYAEVIAANALPSGVPAGPG